MKYHVTVPQAISVGYGIVPTIDKAMIEDVVSSFVGVTDIKQYAPNIRNGQRWWYGCGVDTDISLDIEADALNAERWVFHPAHCCAGCGVARYWEIQYPTDCKAYGARILFGPDEQKPAALTKAASFFVTSKQHPSYEG